MSEEIQKLEAKREALVERVEALRDAEAKLMRADGLRQVIADCVAAKDKEMEALSAVKTERAVVRATAIETLSTLSETLSGRLSDLLPGGGGVVHVASPRELFLGWDIRGKGPVSHESLSGGERVPFDAAVSAMMLGTEGPRLLIVEAAECDPEARESLMRALSLTPEDVQVIVCLWATPGDGWPGPPEGWVSLTVGREGAER
jgi:hypothetical protein